MNDVMPGSAEDFGDLKKKSSYLRFKLGTRKLRFESRGM